MLKTTPIHVDRLKIYLNYEYIYYIIGLVRKNINIV